MPSCTVVTSSFTGPRAVTSQHHATYPRSATTSAAPFDHYGGPRRRHPVPHSFSPMSVHGFPRHSMNPRSPLDAPAYRSSVPTSMQGDYISQSPRQSMLHQVEHSQTYTPPSWAGPPLVQMQVQPGHERWFPGQPVPSQAYAVQQMLSQPATDSITSSPMYGQYSPQVVPPPNYGTSQPQYSPVVSPPNQQLFVVASPQVVSGSGMPQTPSSGQFTPTNHFGFVPSSQPVPNQAQAMPPQPHQAVSSASMGCVVASPPQQYVLANQPLVIQPAPTNQPYLTPQYAKTAPPNVVPQQYIMVPAQQYVLPPPQSGVAPPPASQVYSIVTNQNVPQLSGQPQFMAQPVLAGHRMPVQMAAVPNQYQPIAVQASPLQVMPTNQVQPVIQVVQPGALQVFSTNQPPPTVPANHMQSVVTSPPAPPTQPVYCYVPSVSVIPTNELQPHMPVNSLPSLQHQQQPAAANIQVLLFCLTETSHMYAV